MRKTCAQLVRRVGTSHEISSQLSTSVLGIQNSMWVKPLVTHQSLHNFSVQFYPNTVSKITEVYPQFLHFYTPLIIRTKWVKKENSLVGTGG
jgi:hypothetical protein